MKYIKLVSIVFLVAIATVASSEDKIAVIDMQQAMFASNYAQDIAKQASESADFVALRAKAESSAADLQAMAKEAETKRLTWSTEETAEHQKKMSYTKADYDLAVQKIQGEQQQLQQKIMQELTPQFQEALSEVAKSEGITLLLRRESVIIADPKNDLTAKVVDKLNQITLEK